MPETPGAADATSTPSVKAKEQDLRPSATTRDVPAFGWSAYAERINGRFAMVGFVAVILVEALSGQTFLHWAGLVP
ncbi:MAG: chlorophyll a/b-binding protein [Cyanobacteriota bacterium]